MQNNRYNKEVKRKKNTEVKKKESEHVLNLINTKANQLSIDICPNSLS